MLTYHMIWLHVLISWFGRDMHVSCIRCIVYEAQPSNSLGPASRNALAAAPGPTTGMQQSEAQARGPPNPLEKEGEALHLMGEWPPGRQADN